MESIKVNASRYLLDTHVLLWWLFDEPKLSGTAHDV
jgi:PIN domain nuclease of toxin-antitoxin system